MAVLVFIPELDGDAVGGEGEEFFAESTPGEEEGLSDWRKWWKGSVRDALVVLLLLPLLDEKFGYFRGAREEAVPVAPDGVGGVCLGDIVGISGGQKRGCQCALPAGRRGRRRWDGGRGWKVAYWVFHRFCAALTFLCAVSAVKGGARDMVAAGWSENHWVLGGDAAVGAGLKSSVQLPPTTASVLAYSALFLLEEISAIVPVVSSIRVP